MSSAEWRLAFGQQQSDNMARGLQGAVGGLMGTGMAGAASPQEQIQIADLKAQERISKLATSENPAEVREAAQLLQQRGDSAGAAMLLAQLRAKVQDKYAANQEARSAESFELGKVDRERQITKDAALLKRQKAQQTRQERSLVLQEEAAAREKLRSEAALTDRETKLAQEEGLRTLYETQARSEGREELADAIKDGLSLSSVASLLYTKTSTAAITAPKGAEKVAFEKLLASPAIEDAIPEIFQDNFWGEWGKTSDEADDLIFYKTKEIRQREGNTISVEDAMLEAIKEVAKVLTPTPEGLTPEEVAAQAASLNTGSLAPDGSTDDYGVVK